VDTTPALGFHYFESPERDDDSERVAHLFLYCSIAIRKWPGYRRDAIRRGRLAPAACDAIETHVIRVFEELVNRTLAAIEADNPQDLADPGLGQRLVLAHAYLALHAAPGSLGEYLPIAAEIGEIQGPLPDLSDFERALWEGGWTEAGEHLPAEVTFEQAGQHRFEREGDSVRNSRGWSSRSRRRVARKEHAAEFARPEKRILTNPRLYGSIPPQPYSEEEIATIRREVKGIAIRNGLNKHQAGFIVALVLGGKNRRDDRSATKAIDRKSARLFPEIVALLRKLRPLS
jgi:hypothetical protein